MMLTIHPNIYDTKHSLKQTIEILCDKKNPITDDMILNLVTKYFYAYRHPESSDALVDLAAIDTIRHEYDKYRIIKRIIMKEGGDFVPEKQHQFFYEHDYHVRMLSDIAATTAIVKDVISRELSPQLSSGRYRGLDLGTGTGILLVAQYIQAHRNGYTSPQNIGIDNNAFAVQTTEQLIKNLGCGAVLYGDTTRRDIYLTLYMDSPIHHISNETIPSTTQRMNAKGDPFFKNVATLYTNLHGFIQPQTEFFPSQVGVIAHRGPYGTYMTCAPSNKFLYKELYLGTPTPGQQTSYPDEDMGDKKLSLLRLKEVAIQGVMMHTDCVGKDILDIGKVAPHTYGARR